MKRRFRVAGRYGGTDGNLGYNNVAAAKFGLDQSLCRQSTKRADFLAQSGDDNVHGAVAVRPMRSVKRLGKRIAGAQDQRIANKMNKCPIFRGGQFNG